MSIFMERYWNDESNSEENNVENIHEDEELRAKSWELSPNYIGVKVKGMIVC